MAKRARLTARRRSPETRSGGPADQWPHRRGFTPAPSGLPIAFQLRDILSFRRRGADLDLRGHPRSELGGKLGTLEGYAFLWEAYLREYNPHVIAVARPHEVALVGERVLLDGSRSYSESRIARFEWTFSDGRKASGQTVERTYSQAGTYSEILKITDDRGHTDYDFETVNVLDPQRPEQPPPTIQAAYWPATSIAPRTSVTFKVRTFGATDGEELWSFGDGATARTKSDGNVVPLAKDGFAATTHAFQKPGDYIVRVERTDRSGQKAIGHLFVRVAR